MWPELVPHPSSFVIVGMAGFFAAAAKTPFSTLVIVSEMTGGYHLFCRPSGCASLPSCSPISNRFTARRSDRAGDSPAHQGAFIREALTGVRIDQFIQSHREAPLLPPGTPLSQIVERFNAATDSIFVVADGQQTLMGVIDLEEVYLASRSPELKPVILATDLMRDVQPLTVEDSLERASELFVENELPAMPLVNNLQNRKVLGLVRRSDLAGAYLRLLQGGDDAVV